jgi:glycosyltransferase involved in cell wall biosynthesis
MKKLVLILLLICCCIKVINGFPGLEYVTYPKVKEFKIKKDLPKILKVLVSTWLGGISELEFMTYESFLKKGYDIRVLIPKDSPIEDEFRKRQMPFYRTDILKETSSTESSVVNFKKALYSQICYICKKRKIDIIHCHKAHEYQTVIEVAKKLGIRAIAHYHLSQLPKLDLFKGFDAVLASSPLVAKFLIDANQKQALDIKIVDYVYPPHNEEKFLNFLPIWKTKRDFFKNSFNIDVHDLPVVCTIANFYGPKNHKLLLEAMHTLLYNEQMPIHLILAGRPFRERDNIEKLITALNLSEYVHCVGFTSLVPAILYYSDLKVLPSKNESFGIVLLEAALMKKPIITTTSIDVANILICHEKTGLLCDPNDPNDLAKQIKRIFTEPQLGKVLGENIYALARASYSNQAALDKYEKIYKELYAAHIH